MELKPGLIVAGRFQLVRPLGKGGMGAVWLGQQTALDVPCALKFIHEEAAQNPELRARFEREAKAAAQLRSPHVVQILDHGLWEGMPYIAMELLEGEDLEHRLHKRGTLAPQETLGVAVQVGRALSKAHSVGLVHRDLKPANIFLTRDEDREIAKVLDFGVAKVNDSAIDGSTKTGAVLGTPYYMSPEQARGSKTIDHRSDLWALAVVVFQCITGRLPFMGEALGDLFVKIIIVEPLPVPSQTAIVPPGFDGWWARAASRNPAERFQTAKEFTDTLGLALGVTVGSGVEVGSVMASSGAGMPMGSSGTVAMMTPNRPLTPYPGGATPQPGAVPSPSGAWAARSAPGTGPNPAWQAPGQPVPQSGAWQAGGSQPGLQNAGYPMAAMGAAPTPMQQSLNTSQAPAPSRTGLIVGCVIGVLALTGGGAFFMLSSGAKGPVPAPAASAAAPPAPQPATAPARPSAAVEAPSATATSAVAAPSASATASASASAAPSAVPSAVPAHAGPEKGHAAPRPPGGAKASPPPDSLGF